jgi:glycosyltransferase involved in cell wall biosynthesis
VTAKTVICVIGSLNVGGAERHLIQVLPRLDRSRWNPLVYCLAEPGVLAPQLEAAGVPVFCSPIAIPSKEMSRPHRMVRIAKTTLKLATTMRAIKPAIAHFFLPAAYILGAPAALLARVPVRIMSRRSLNEYQSDWRISMYMEPMLHKTMNAVLGNSHRVVEQLRDEEGVPPAKLGLIYNGIDVSQYRLVDRRAHTRTTLGIEPDALTFIIVANLIPYKGHRDLLAAFARGCQQLPTGWRLLLVGRDDGILDELRAQAASLGIDQNVLFLGTRHDVPDLLQAADVSLLSSHQEGFSNSVLEGMAAGLPSIVTDVGGNAEAVVDGESGLVVPARDPVRFAEAITKLAASGELRATMGKNAHHRVEQNFTLDACVLRYETLYDALVAGRKPGDIDSIRAT